MLGRVSLGLGLLVVGFMVASASASGSKDEAEAVMPEAEPESMRPQPPIAPEGPEAPLFIPTPGEPKSGADSRVDPVVVEEPIQLVKQSSGASEDAKLTASSTSIKTRKSSNRRIPKSMSAWWKFLKPKVNGACDDKVAVETRARVLHAIDGGWVKNVDVEVTGNDQLDTCIRSMLNNRIREGWSTSTESSGAPLPYEYVVKPKER